MEVCVQWLLPCRDESMPCALPPRTRTTFTRLGSDQVSEALTESVQRQRQMMADSSDTAEAAPQRHEARQATTAALRQGLARRHLSHTLQPGLRPAERWGTSLAASAGTERAHTRPSPTRPSLLERFSRGDTTDSGGGDKPERRPSLAERLDSIRKVGDVVSSNKLSNGDSVGLTGSGSGPLSGHAVAGARAKRAAVRARLLAEEDDPLDLASL